MPDEPKSILEHEPRARGPRLAALIFLLWLPLAIGVLTTSVLMEVSIPLIAAFAAGTALSLALAVTALKLS